MSDAIPADFYARSQQEQDDFLTYTWCNQCGAADLGMVEPKEYLLKGVTYIEGKCKVCGDTVMTELSEGDND
ncbi:MAG: hypothetical protein ACPGPF_06130 [Pontibacterium sp.]